MKIRLEVKKSSLQSWRNLELRFGNSTALPVSLSQAPPILGHDRKGVTDACKWTKRLPAHHKGQNLGSVNNSWCTPVSHGVECLYRTCQHFYSARQQVVETQSFPAKQLPLLR